MTSLALPRRLAAGFALMAVVAVGCSSDDGEADVATETPAEVTDDTAAPDDAMAEEPAEPADDTAEAPADESEADSEEPGGGTGPDGVYQVGDVFSDGDVLFTYEGLVQVSYDQLGSYSDGECYFAIGTVTAVTEFAGAFRPSFDPIFDGVPDREQNNQFFDCSFEPVQTLGYVQGTVTDLTVGDSVMIWLDAIYVSPERAGTLDGFRLYGMDDMTFSAEVTQNLVTTE